MTRKTVFLIILVLVLVFAACDVPNGTTTPPSEESPTATPTATLSVTDTPAPPTPTEVSEEPVSEAPDDVPSDEPVVPTVAVGELTGDATLDGEVLAVIEKVCSVDATLNENLWACFDWMVKNLSYRGIAVDLSEGYTDALVTDLARVMILNLRGSCEHQAALFCVFAQRLGCEAEVVAGEFLDDDGVTWVEHAWVIAKTDESYRHFDVLFGRNHTGGNAKSMFAQTDASIVRHRWDADEYPACE